ncbi:virulence RhuM family protein [Cellulophaga baltica]|uniref:virulence RhuM family protein n=1 Tax=Cellulophaga baltica TaxID=76594 RepID=UPI000425A221|nr:RhuM family protein [Cellulophaga baltica]
MMNKGEIILYNDKPNVEIRLENNTIWLNQKQMAELFDKDSDTIGLHLKNIYTTKELNKNATTEKYSVVQIEGKREVNRKVLFYNLDAIISVGYRVNSKRGTQFRIWANSILKDYLVQGYAIMYSLYNMLTMNRLKYAF